MLDSHSFRSLIAENMASAMGLGIGFETKLIFGVPGKILFFRGAVLAACSLAAVTRMLRANTESFFSEPLFMDIIPNDKLTLDMLPGPEATEGEFVEFGHTFNGYEALPDCDEVANKSARAFAEHAALPESLNELRACLFYEQRRNRHCGSEASEEDLRYYHALVAAMREIIEKQYL